MKSINQYYYLDSFQQLIEKIQVIIMANKLQQLKKKLLLQKQKTQNPQKSIAASILAEVPSQLAVAAQISNIQEPKIQVQQIKNVGELNEEQIIQKQKVIEQRQEEKQEPNVDVQNNPSPQQEEDDEQELQQGQEGEQRQKSALSQNSPKKEIILTENNKPAITEKISGLSESLQLIRQPNISVSIDQEVRQAIIQKNTELKSKNIPEQQQKQSKVQKKTKKIILKQLYKVKQSLKNMQEAINGLQYIQQKIKYYPHLRQRISSYITNLKSLNK